MTARLFPPPPPVRRIDAISAERARRGIAAARAALAAHRPDEEAEVRRFREARSALGRTHHRINGRTPRP